MSVGRGSISNSAHFYSAGSIAMDTAADAAVNERTCSLLLLPPDVLAIIWSGLDPGSRRALYSSCRGPREALGPLISRCTIDLFQPEGRLPQQAQPRHVRIVDSSSVQQEQRGLFPTPPSRHGQRSQHDSLVKRVVSQVEGALRFTEKLELQVGFFWGGGGGGSGIIPYYIPQPISPTPALEQTHRHTGFVAPPLSPIGLVSWHPSRSRPRPHTPSPHSPHTNRHECRGARFRPLRAALPPAARAVAQR